MRKALFIILLLSLPAFPSHGQSPVGGWSDHLIYNTASSVAASENDIFASTGSSVIVYNKELSELRKMSRISGLSETGISTIGWSADYSSLIIGYSSTNVDIVKDNVIYNIPDISRKYIPGKKAINRIRTKGKYAFLACSFGIVVADLNKKEVYDTWKPGSGTVSAEVWDIALGGGKIYAATSNGVYFADLTDPGLAYFGNWKAVSSLPVPGGNYTAAAYSGNKLYVNLSDPQSDGDRVYAVGDESALFSYTTGVYNKSFDSSSDGFIISSAESLRVFNTGGQLVKSITSYGPNFSSPSILQAAMDNNNIWIADKESGLVMWENMNTFTALTLPGPVTNNVIDISSENGRTIISAGSITQTWNNTWTPLQVSLCIDNKWSAVTSDILMDPIRAIGDPDNPNRFFVATWGMGLLEYENNILGKTIYDIKFTASDNNSG